MTAGPRPVEDLEAPVLRAEPATYALGNLEGDNLIASATAIAQQLAGVVNKQGLVKIISGRKYPMVEAWTTLGALLGCFPREVSVEEKKPGIYTSTVEFVSLQTGKVISRASAQCGDQDEVWGKRPAYARQSMATTRATGKAGRMAWSWIMSLAGYEVTPAEEVPDGGFDDAPPASEPRNVTPQRNPGGTGGGGGADPKPAIRTPIAPDGDVAAFRALIGDHIIEVGGDLEDAAERTWELCKKLTSFKGRDEKMFVPKDWEYFTGPKARARMQATLRELEKHVANCDCTPF